MIPRADLHTHSIYSDGELIPAELVRRAQVLGHEVIAITDHVDMSNVEWVVTNVVKACELSEDYCKVIPGVEITIPILMGEALDAIEIRSPHGFYDYDAKYLYKYGHTQYFCPPESLEQSVIEHAKHLAILFYHATGCRDLLRVDFIIDSSGVPMMLEGNSLPGCTATSLVPKAARRAGISLERLAATLTYAALKRPAAPADEKLTVYSRKDK